MGDIYQGIIDEVIAEETALAVRLAGKEMADSYLMKWAIYDIIKDLTTEEVQRVNVAVVSCL